MRNRLIAFFFGSKKTWVFAPEEEIARNMEFIRGDGDWSCGFYVCKFYAKQHTYQAKHSIESWDGCEHSASLRLSELARSEFNKFLVRKAKHEHSNRI